MFLKATGKKLGTVTWTQDRSGVKISVNQALPGDLYFWGVQGNTSHVGIAIGNGNFIHSPEKNDVVKITNIQYYPPDFAIRMELSEEAPYTVVLSTKKVFYQGTLKTGQLVYNLPYGSQGSKVIANTKDYQNRTATVTKEIVTQFVNGKQGTWIEMSVDGKILGLMDKAHLIS